ncbi:Ni,Fe-hydrogenase III large subunit [Anoxybacillus tepidamans]|uniref:Ni,Fe-hydrogenase III large subunit n=1 Tax=Anoxybacteroides tepidamans TaxID=265948 RepID=A0A7W8MTG8_9BACL|nr:NADH-quinone oxidoreductase subunit C [Anoxybacillus tepidamans]MBB5323129.1 Ni,Fe-hydrogenase III large subunit [Anoxybacillus tepidamans]
MFSFDRFRHFLTVKTLINPLDPTFPSVAVQLPAANWYEREVKDLLGLRPQGHPDPRPLVLHGDWPEDLHPLRKDFPLDQHAPRVQSREAFMRYDSEDVTEIPVGPIHAGIIEPGHFRFGAVGDTILHLDARLFFTHRGLEKASEGMPVQKALFLAERICGVCALSHSIAFAQAIERAGNVTIPPRADYLRTLFLELERLYNHIGDVGNICAGFGFAVGISQGARLKEELQQLNERITGHRYLRGVVSLGGMRADVTEQEREDIYQTLQYVKKEFKELVDLLLTHDIAINRMATTGILRLEHANDLEVVGVAARASGRSVDIRRDQPYAAYDRVHFHVPVYKEGDVLARIRVRIDEVFESFSIIKQLLQQLLDGDIRTNIPNLTPYRSAMGWCESPRGETVHWVMIGPNQTVYRYRVRSATYSNWPAVPLAVKGNIVPDFPLINKSFELCYACCDR